jgi:hypothetical protein
MGGWGSAVRGVLAGLNEAAGNPQRGAEWEAANERARQAKLSELQMRLLPHGLAIRGLQEQIQALNPPVLDPKAAGYDKDKADEFNTQKQYLTNEIAKNLYAFREILHPDENPQGNFFERGITDKLHLTHLQSRIKKAGEKKAKGEKQDTESAQAIAQGAVPWGQTPEGQKLAYMRETQIEAAKARAQGTADAMKRHDYEQYQLQHPEYTGTFEQWVAEQGAVGRETGTGGKQKTVAGPDGKPILAFERGGKYYDQQGKLIENAIAYEKMPAAQPKQGTSKTAGGNTYAVLTPQGWKDTNTGTMLHDFKPYPSFAQMGLYEPIVSIDPNTGQFAAGTFDRRTGRTIVSVSSHVPIPTNVFAQLSKNIEPALAANSRFLTMKESEPEAIKANQQAQLNIVTNHLGMTQGAQTGARIGKYTFEEALNSAPWLQVQVAKWFHQDPATGDYIFDGYKSGVNLTPTQVHQMVDLAAQRRRIAWQQVQAAAGMFGAPLDVTGQEETEPTPITPGAKSVKSTRGIQKLNDTLDKLLGGK